MPVKLRVLSLCVVFGRKVYRKLSVEQKHKNTEDYNRYVRAELYGEHRQSFPSHKDTAETAAKCSKWSVRHERFQSEVRIMDV